MATPNRTFSGSKNPLSTVTLPHPVLRDRPIQPMFLPGTLAASTTYDLGNPAAWTAAQDGLDYGLYLLICPGVAEYGLFLDYGGTVDPVSLITGTTNIVAGDTAAATRIAFTKNSSGNLTLLTGSGTNVATNGVLVIKIC